MSETSQGGGWWLASDQRWYPPELHPDARDSDAARPGTGLAESPDPGSGSGQRGNGLAAIAIAVILIAGAVAGWFTWQLYPTSYATGTPAGTGFLCSSGPDSIYITWSTSDGQVHGKVWQAADSQPVAVPFNGTETGNHLDWTESGVVLSGHLSGKTLLLTSGGLPSGLLCVLEPREKWLRLASSEPRLPAAIDRAAQSNVVNAITASKAIYVNSNGYPPTASALATALGRMEPELTFSTGEATSPTQISVAEAPNAQSIILAAHSSDGRCWYASDNENAKPGPTGLPGPVATQGVSYNASPVNGPESGCTAGDIGTVPLLGGWRTMFPETAPRPAGYYKELH